jgi:hypothetical protein
MVVIFVLDWPVPFVLHPMRSLYPLQDFANKFWHAYECSVRVYMYN